jgi:hypothetical protein
MRRIDCPTQVCCVARPSTQNDPPHSYHGGKPWTWLGFHSYPGEHRETETWPDFAHDCGYLPKSGCTVTLFEPASLCAEVTDAKLIVTPELKPRAPRIINWVDDASAGAYLDHLSCIALPDAVALVALWDFDIMIVSTKILALMVASHQISLTTSEILLTVTGRPTNAPFHRSPVER